MLLKPIAHCVLFSLLCSPALTAQGWQSVRVWGGTGQESVEVLQRVNTSTILVGGSFSDRIQVGDQAWTAVGETDIYLAQYVEGHGLAGSLHLGGPGADALAGLAPLPSGDFLCGGTFWQYLPLPNGDTLSSSRNPKALFIAQFSAAGTLRWAKKLEGGSLKNLHRIAVSEEGLYLTGYFSDTLFIDTLQLVSQGVTDAFLIKLDTSGQVCWGKQFGGRGDVRATALAIGAGGSPVVAGIYNQQVFFTDTLLTANTRDWDLFIASFTPQGEVMWVRKAGGVYDDEVYDMVADAQGAVYLTGQLVGVMRLSPTIEIQSQDGNADAFVLKYTADGQPRWAVPLAGAVVQTGYRLKLQGAQLAVVGYYQGTLEWAAQEIRSENVYNGFLALLDTSGRALALTPLPGAAPVFATALETDGRGGWQLGGVYQGQPQWGAVKLSPPQGGFDAFIAHWQPTVTAAHTPTWVHRVHLFPNPAQEWLYIQVPEPGIPKVWLVSGSGSMVVPPQHGYSIELSEVPPGFYVAYIQVGSVRVARKILVQR